MQSGERLLCNHRQTFTDTTCGSRYTLYAILFTAHHVGRQQRWSAFLLVQRPVARVPSDRLNRQAYVNARLRHQLRATGVRAPPPTLCKIRLTIIAITHKYTKITITRKASRPKEGREEGREWCLRHASKYIFGLVWPYSLTFCTQFVVSQRAFTIMCACQVWLNFVAQFFSHLAEMDFWLTIFRPIMVLTFDPQTPKLAISCTCFVDDCVNLYQNRFIRFQNITYNGWLDKIE